MIVKELLDYLYHLRVKYHYNKFDALHYYNFLKYSKFVDIKEDEEHFLMHVYILGYSPIYSYRTVDTSGSIYLKHGRYVPNLKVNRFCMLWISSGAKNSGLSMRVKDEEIDTVVSDQLSYNIHTLEPRSLKILRSFPDKRTNKLMTKKRIGEYTQSGVPYAVRYTLATGIPQLQRAGMLPVKFTYRDLDLRRLYSRAEAFQFIF